jgi:uncharacterized membrane protein YedE/YeeE
MAMLTGLAGGALIGLAAALYWFATGRVAGVSGILAGALRERQARNERLAFLAGLVAAGLVAALLSAPASASASPYPLPVLVVAGALVGFGTRLGGGCTSGHGVCGVSRGSLSSLVATATFIATGAATVAIATRLLGAGGAP